MGCTQPLRATMQFLSLEYCLNTTVINPDLLVYSYDIHYLQQPSTGYISVDIMISVYNLRGLFTFCNSGNDLNEFMLACVLQSIKWSCNGYKLNCVNYEFAKFLGTNLRYCSEYEVFRFYVMWSFVCMTFRVLMVNSNLWCTKICLNWIQTVPLPARCLILN